MCCNKSCCGGRGSCGSYYYRSSLLHRTTSDKSSAAVQYKWSCGSRIRTILHSHRGGNKMVSSVHNSSTSTSSTDHHAFDVATNSREGRQRMRQQVKRARARIIWMLLARRQWQARAGSHLSPTMPLGPSGGKRPGPRSRLQLPQVTGLHRCWTTCGPQPKAATSTLTQFES